VRRGRAVTWIAAWAAGAALALLVAWLGVRAVLHSTTGPVVPVIGAPGRTGPSAAALPGSSRSVRPPGSRRRSGQPPAGPRASSPATSTPSRTPSPAAGPSPAQPADVHIYTVTGGRVTLEISETRCTLIGATAGSGYTAEDWSSMGWLRVDFNRNGTEASSLVCDWYQQAPAVTIGR
jgi:hypothetical protein